MPTTVLNSTDGIAASAQHALAGSTLGSFSVSPWVKFTVSFPQMSCHPLGPFVFAGVCQTLPELLLNCSCFCRFPVIAQLFLQCLF